MFIGGRRLRGSLRLVPPPHPTRLLFSHARHQPAPATHWFAGVAQFQTGRRTPKDATLLLHRSVPPSVLVESCKTQLYQPAQNDAQLLFSTNGVFRVEIASPAMRSSSTAKCWRQRSRRPRRKTVWRPSLPMMAPITSILVRSVDRRGASSWVTSRLNWATRLNRKQISRKAASVP